MHEIKFRMWNKKEKKMYDIGVLDFDDKKAYMKEYLNYTVSNYMFEDIEIMQYTGLKDKNGTEIYEGDIVRIDKEDYKYIVKFYDGCFVGVSIYDEHYEQAKILGNLFTFEIEVIGNIYDNSELLENIKDKE